MEKKDISKAIKGNSKIIPLTPHGIVKESDLDFNLTTNISKDELKFFNEIDKNNQAQWKRGMDTGLIEGRLRQMKYELDFLKDFRWGGCIGDRCIWCDSHIKIMDDRIKYLEEFIKEFKYGN